jgi:hypothetical protein
MKKTATTIALAILGTATLASCTTETVIREVPATDPPANTAPPTDDFGVSTAEAIATARESVPSLWSYTDAEMFEMMSVACDALDEWAPDYAGFISNMEDVLSTSSTQETAEATALIAAGASSICSYHMDDLMDALEFATL